MKRLIGVSIVLLSVAAFAGDVAARAKEIAAWLPEKPCVEGAPITDARWGELAQLPEGVKTIQAAEKLLAKPVPETPDEWLDSIDGVFSVYDVLPEVIDLWDASVATTSTPAKK